jgi:hypothetical protein
MNITIFGAGSQGDIQPCVMLGKALQKAGFDLFLAAPENFAPFVAWQVKQGVGSWRRAAPIPSNPFRQ